MSLGEQAQGARRSHLERVLTAVLLAFFAGLYVYVAPSLEHQPWDSLWYVWAAENPGAQTIIPMHPLGHVVLNAALGLARSLGYAGRALPVFVVVNALCSGAAVAVMYRLASKVLRLSMAASLGFSLFMGGTLGLLAYTGTADIYSMTVLAACAFLAALLALPPDAGLAAWVRIGLLAGVATAVHQINGFVCLIGFVTALRRGAWRRAVGFGLAASLTVGGLLWVCGFASTGSANPVRVLGWLFGHFGSQQYGSFLQADFLTIGGRTVLNLFYAQPWGSAAQGVRLALGAAALALLLAGVCRWRWLPPLHRPVQALLLLQVTVTALLICMWCPWSKKIWLTTLAPVLGLAVLGWSAWGGAGPRSGRGRALRAWADGGVLALGVLTLAFNLYFAGVTQRRDTPLFTASMRAWLQHTGPADCLMTAGDLTAPLKFWAGRPFALSVDSVYGTGDAGGKFAVLRAAFQDRQQAGASVYVAPSVTRHLWGVLAAHSGASDAGFQTFLDGFRWEYAFSYTNDMDRTLTPVYRLAP